MKNNEENTQKLRKQHSLVAVSILLLEAELTQVFAEELRHKALAVVVRFAGICMKEKQKKKKEKTRTKLVSWLIQNKFSL